ncbi:thiocillin family RiPP [Kitasatospora sp. NPDC002227]|uniref:thiocillin family RiPP n=1 Tax=Kitasatospora sp. NPDC002227 TaxID=3154773 RepID=UPI00332B8FEC
MQISDLEIDLFLVEEVELEQLADSALAWGIGTLSSVGCSCAASTVGTINPWG